MSEDSVNRPGTILVANDRSGCMRDLQACGLEYGSVEQGPALAVSCKRLFDSAEPVVALVNFESQKEGPQTVACILENHPAARLIAFADTWEDGRRLGALESGAHALVNCGDGAVSLLTVVVAQLGEAACRLQIIRSGDDARKRWLALSATEYYVLRGAFTGVTNQAVALQCDISVRTVDRQRNSAFMKLDCETLLDIVARMYQAGLQTLPSEHSELLIEVGRLQSLAY